MNGLIERLEKATGPDLDLDHAIAAFARPADGHGVLLYTGSFDAAVTLLPTGLFWLLGVGKTRPDEPLGAAQIIAPGSCEVLAEAEHASYVIAFCIAAIKATGDLQK